MRGDVPTCTTTQKAVIPFSPRARGCSEAAEGLKGPFDVFPACAGMFRGSSMRIVKRRCFPRVRGDVP